MAAGVVRWLLSGERDPGITLPAPLPDEGAKAVAAWGPSANVGGPVPLRPPP